MEFDVSWQRTVEAEAFDGNQCQGINGVGDGVVARPIVGAWEKNFSQARLFSEGFRLSDLCANETRVILRLMPLSELNADRALQDIRYKYSTLFFSSSGS